VASELVLFVLDARIDFAVMSISVGIHDVILGIAGR
jgi:hypothetical protein